MFLEPPASRRRPSRPHHNPSAGARGRFGLMPGPAAIRELERRNPNRSSPAPHHFTAHRARLPRHSVIEPTPTAPRRSPVALPALLTTPSGAGHPDSTGASPAPTSTSPIPNVASAAMPASTGATRRPSTTSVTLAPSNAAITARYRCSMTDNATNANPGAPAPESATADHGRGGLSLRSQVIKPVAPGPAVARPPAKGRSARRGSRRPRSAPSPGPGQLGDGCSAVSAWCTSSVSSRASRTLAGASRLVARPSRQAMMWSITAA
jgi:hypothetical protein